MPDKNNSHHHRPGRPGRGPSSYWMHDPEDIFAELALNPGDYFLDLGCGPGDYSIRAAEIIGDTGVVYALDSREEAIDKLMEKIAPNGPANIRAINTDITLLLPLADHSIDVCLMATVLHVPQVTKAGPRLFREIHRVVKPGGRLAIIECKKENQSFGPPMHMRLSPEEVEAALKGQSFKKISYADLGYNYLVQFRVE